MTFRESEVLERVAGITEVRLRAWVSQGWVNPVRSDDGDLFGELDIARCELIRQIEDELRMDSESIPVVLSLLDQVYGLRRELRLVMRAIEQQPKSVRESILSSLGSE